MKTLEETVQVKRNKKTAATKCNIHYVVKYQIVHLDKNRKSTILVKSEVIYRDANPIKARKRAFNDALEIDLSSREEGQLFDEHLDSMQEGMLKKRKNINIFSIEVNCVNDITDEEIMINEANFESESEEDFLDDLITEYLWYKEMGHSAKGMTKTVDYDGMKHSILKCNIDSFVNLHNLYSQN